MSSEQNQAEANASNKNEPTVTTVEGETPEITQSVSAEAAPTKSKKSKKSKPLYTNGQTNPPSIEPSKLYPDGFPTGLAMPYGFAYNYADPRFSTEILAVDDKCKEILADATEDVLCYREAAEIHREVRAYARRIIKPGVSLLAACEDIESRIRCLCGRKKEEMDSALPGRRCGQAFPCGVSYNYQAAHYAPLNAGDDHIVTENDVVKVDFGVHCLGRVIDSAFTMTWNSVFDPLVEASREATAKAISLAGPDVALSDIGNIIEETISSYEVAMPKQGRSDFIENIKLQPVRNLCGHQVGVYKVHAGKSIPNHAGGTPAQYGRMLEGETYACETFASTGNGAIHDELPVSHFMLNPEAQASRIKDKHAKGLFSYIKNNYQTLAFCPRWFRHIPANICEKNLIQSSMNYLVKSGFVHDYPILVDKSKSYVSQSEHTFMLKHSGKEIFSKGDDY